MAGRKRKICGVHRRWEQGRLLRLFCRRAVDETGDWIWGKRRISAGSRPGFPAGVACLAEVPARLGAGIQLLIGGWGV